MSATRESVLDPEVRKRIASLTLQARRAVEGLLTGVHRSPHRGASVVFVEHREYRPGDDLRLLDWRAFARSDRHTIKRFEQETQLRATLVLDRSGSMQFQGETGAAKLDHAATLLAALAYVLVRQGDAAGLAAIDAESTELLPARSRPAQIELLAAALTEPAVAGRPTDLSRALRGIAEHAGRRGLVAIASDLLDLRDDALAPLGQLVAHGHEVVVLHVLSPDELDLPRTGPARFVGLEGEPSIDCDPEPLRAGYARELGVFLERCRSSATAAGARYVLARTDEPVERALAQLLTGARARGFR